MNVDEIREIVKENENLNEWKQKMGKENVEPKLNQKAKKRKKNQIRKGKKTSNKEIALKLT